MDIKEEIDKDNLPRHIAVIMDGNGRWAKKKGATRIFGHKSAVKSVMETVEGAAELGIKYLTLYAFSTENWFRPSNEINALMELLVSTINKEIKKLTENKIRLLTIGDINSLPSNCKKKLQEATDITRNCDRMTLIVAVSYSGRWEIVEAVKKIVNQAKKGLIDTKDLNESLFASYLNTKDIPDPELLIRTSGELRISNFLLWQIAYAELYFTELLWPDFTKEELYKAIISYQKRERRFGKISEQLNS
ncbi:MAG: isoprenyl transferase [Cytophagales bacterium]|nr:isoprenyl transferase [Cytophagales bacterium]